MFIDLLLAAAAISLLSLSGALFFKTKHLTYSHRFIIPVAIGVFLGVIFFELIPETIEASHEFGAMFITAGFLSFYLLSHLLKTYHHHHDYDDSCTNKIGAKKLLIGDTIHNIADGVVITSAFMINPTVGIATAIGIALHEIPQEIAEYGVLLSAGYSKRKALLFNFLSATSIFIGIAITFLVINLGDYVWMLTGLAAGNLLYIAASDMIPELTEKNHHGHFWQTFLSTILGLIIIVTLISLGHHE